MFNMSDINRSSVKVKRARTKLSTLEDISVKKVIMYLPFDEDEAVFADFLCFPLPASRASRYAGVTSSVGYIPEKQDVSKS